MRGLPQCGLRFHQEALSRMGEDDGALGLAAKKLRAELRFQRANLMAQRRRSDIESRRGATEMQLLGHGGEIAQVAQLHLEIL